jgi:hypothetical protein
VRTHDDRRVLIVAHKSVATPALVNAVRRRIETGPCAFSLLIPDAGNAVAAAWTLRCARRMLSKTTGTAVDGVVSDGNDAYAGVVRALSVADYDEILLSILPDPNSRWLREDLPARVEALGVPVTVVTADAVTA